MRYDDYLSTVDEWNDEAKQGLADRMRADYDKWSYDQVAMENEMVAAIGHIAHLRDFREEHGFSPDERLDMMQTSDAALMPSVPEEQARLRDVSEYLASGDNYRELAGIIRDALQIERQEQVGLKDAYQYAFGTDVHELLADTLKSAEGAGQAMLDREAERMRSMGVKDYAMACLDTYGTLPSTNEAVVKDGLCIAQSEADMAYDSKARRRDELAREAQRKARLNNEMGYDLDEESPFAEYERYNRETDFTAEIDQFRRDCAEIYARGDSDESRRQVAGIIKDVMPADDWKKFKESLPEARTPSCSDAELSAAFDKPHDAWEAEHQEQLE